MYKIIASTQVKVEAIFLINTLQTSLEEYKHTNVN